MRRAAALILVFALFGALPALAKSGGIQWQKGSLDDALPRALAERKLVLVDCWASWCTFCFQMDDEVWSDPSLARQVDKLAVPLKAEVDVGRGIGLNLHTRYDAEGLPLVLILHPEDGRALIRLQGYQNAEAILVALEEAHAMAFPPDGTEETDPAALLRRANRQLRREDLVSARRYAEQALALDPRCEHDHADEAMLVLADVLAAARESDGLVERLREVAHACRGASRVDALWERLVTYSRRAGGDKAVLAVLTERVESEPTNTAARLTLADALLAAGEKALAKPHFEQVLAEAGDDPRPLEALASIYHEEGKADEARAMIERAIRLNPHDPDLRELRLRIALSQRR